MEEKHIKICLLLAAAGYREDEIYQFADFVRSVNPHHFAEYIRHLRHNIMSGAKRDRFYDHERPRDSQDIYSITADKVLRLLIEEAGLSRAQAAELIRAEIQARAGEGAIPPLGRRGFVEWLRLLMKVIPPSEILHFATAVRNKIIHQGDIDWRLK